MSTVGMYCHHHSRLGSMIRLRTWEFQEDPGLPNPPSSTITHLPLSQTVLISFFICLHYPYSYFLSQLSSINLLQTSNQQQPGLQIPLLRMGIPNLYLLDVGWQIHIPTYMYPADVVRPGVLRCSNWICATICHLGQVPINNNLSLNPPLPPKVACRTTTYAWTSTSLHPLLYVSTPTSSVLLVALFMLLILPLCTIYLSV